MSLNTIVGLEPRHMNIGDFVASTFKEETEGDYCFKFLLMEEVKYFYSQKYAMSSSEAAPKQSSYDRSGTQQSTIPKLQDLAKQALVEDIGSLAESIKLSGPRLSLKTEDLDGKMKFYRLSKRQFNEDSIQKLRKEELRRLLFPLIANDQPSVSLSNFSMTFFSYVISDGLGDFANLMHVTNSLHHEYPELFQKIKVIALVPEKFKEVIQKAFSFFTETFKEQLHLYYHNYKVYPPKDSDFSIDQETQQWLKTTSIFLEISTAPKEGLEKIYQYLPDQVLHAQIGESAATFDIERLSMNQDENTHTFYTNNLGFHPTELGMFIDPGLKRHTNSGSLFQLKDKELQQRLLDGEESDAYQSNNSLFFCYMTRHFSHPLIYIFTMVKYSDDNSKNIDIALLGNQQKTVNVLKFCLNYPSGTMREFIKKCGIHKVKIISRNTEHSPFESFTYLSKDPESEEQKTLRIIAPAFLTNEDILTLMAFSESPCGVTGDTSFADAIGMNKLPIYEMDSFKKVLYNYYIEIVEANIPSEEAESFLKMAEKLKGLPDRSISTPYVFCEELGALLKNRKILEVNSKVNCIISSQYNAVSSIPKIVRRALLHRAFPELVDVEKEFIERVYRSKQPLSEHLKWLREKQEAFSLS
ncbi:MAG: hypothetical protein AAGG81_07110 [Chlamydiota bacterium]